MRYYLKSKLSKEEIKKINKFVEINESCGNMFQQPFWVNIEKKNIFRRYLFFYGEDIDGKMVISAVIKRIKIPLLNWYIDNIRRGPVFVEIINFKEGVLELLRMLKRKGSIYIKMNPYFSGEKSVEIEEILKSYGFSSSKKQDLHSTTLVVDLEDYEDVIFKKFRVFTQRAIKKAYNFNVIPKFANSIEDVKEFCLLYKKMAEKKNILKLKYSFLYRLWSFILRKKKNGILILSKYQGKTMGGIIVLRHANRAVYTYGASLVGGYDEIPKTHLLHWEAIKWAKSVGCKFYDLGGYAVDTKKIGILENINWFKTGFSKQQISFVGEYEYIFSGWKYKIISNLINFYLKVFR
ncbi:MAG: peptidoglycan bridge formation glycyltransferase FemA/FemB family protein [Endomicrobia bacterium]|nr:peptidoglycan bridge formation glycyltransferase FemA/FemB family protein [Endomicrobiia bacterium]